MAGDRTRTGVLPQRHGVREPMRALTHAGFTVWVVARRRGMPTGHSMADIADDYGALIRDEFGGRVDLVHGVSYGGAVVQYLAARHPEVTHRIVITARRTR
jgi:pimeloyl-ACP methyl ester carboxylesterase